MHPAGAMPSSNVGAGNSRPWYVHITASARFFFTAGVGSERTRLHPERVEHAALDVRLELLLLRLLQHVARRAPMAAFEYFVRSPGG